MKTLREFQFHIFAFIVTMIMAFMSIGCQGKRGHVGAQGAVGEGCTVVQLANGAEIKCAQGTSAVILNGLPGVNGTDGVDGAPGAHAVLATITPCKDPNKMFQESILLLENGQLLGHYSDGKKQFLTLLTPGNYRTTDGFNCAFTVTLEGNVVWN